MERMVPNQELQLAARLCVPPAVDLQREELHQGRDAEALEPRDLGLGERLVAEIDQGRASPQRQGVGEKRLRPGAQVRPRRPDTFRDQLPEAPSVDVGGVDLKAIATDITPEQVRAGPQGAPQS